MFSRCGRHIRQQFVGYVALFVALGGVSYATIVLPKNSVGSPQIKNGQVKTADLANNAVTSPKVKDGSLLSADFAPGQLVPGSPGATGPQGLKGDTGLQGLKGDTGLQGLKGDTGLQGLKGDTGTQGPGASKFDFDHPASDTSALTILDMGDMSLTAQCGAAGGAALVLKISSTVSATANAVMGTDTMNYGTVSWVTLGMSVPVSPGANVVNVSPGTGFARVEVQLVYRNSTRVVTAAIHAIANATSGRCQVQGTATPSSAGFSTVG